VMDLPAAYRILDLSQAKRRGRHLWVCCPFHADRRPSLAINLAEPFRWYFRCWACGQHGSPQQFAELTGQRLRPGETLICSQRAMERAGEPTLPDFSAAHRWNVQRIRRDPRRLQELAERLGVSADALRRLGCGWNGQAWTLPMWRQSRVARLKHRWPDGRKDCQRGSKLGLLLPDGQMPKAETVLVVEGESDLTAALTLGFEGIGLLGVLNCWELLADVIRGRNVVVCFDADRSGQTAADSLIRKLAPRCRSIRRIVPDAKDPRLAPGQANGRGTTRAHRGGQSSSGRRNGSEMES